MFKGEVGFVIDPKDITSKIKTTLHDQVVYNNDLILIDPAGYSTTRQVSQIAGQLKIDDPTDCNVPRYRYDAFRPVNKNLFYSY